MSTKYNTILLLNVDNSLFIEKKLEIGDGRGG